MAIGKAQSVDSKASFCFLAMLKLIMRRDLGLL